MRKWGNEEMSKSHEQNLIGGLVVLLRGYGLLDRVCGRLARQGRVKDYGSNSSSEGTHSSYGHQFRVHRANVESVESATKER